MHNNHDGVNVSLVATHMQSAYARRVTATRTKSRKTPPAAREPSVAELGAWVVSAMEAKGHNQKSLERASGVKQSQISRARRGKVSNLVLQRLADSLGVAVPPHLLAATVPGRRPRGAPETAPALAASTGARPMRAGFDVPIFHTLFVGRGPSFYLQSAPTSFAWRPPILGRARNAFMLRMPDHSMSPWRERDEPIYCDPDRAIENARHALVQFEGPGPQDPWAICRIVTPPIPGGRLDGRIYRLGRGQSLPSAPVRRAIPILEWTDLMPA
jgi:transcriptional regulator with XRE-family HTH domain